MPKMPAAGAKMLLKGFMLLLVGAFAQAQETAPEHNAGFKNLLDSVVRIDVWENDYTSGAKRISRGIGSGVIMDGQGHILTNAHVANPEAERILVTLANLERVSAKFIGWDHWTDLAVLQLDLAELEKRKLSFAHAQFADSGAVQPGDIVYAVGTPHGLARTVTRGIISNNKRYFEGSSIGRGYETGYFNTWLQTDAAINPGNSGGPLVLPDGRVAGINTQAYLGANNLGFSVPSSTARDVMRRIVESGSVSRSYIGIVPGPMQDLESFFDIAIKTGMLIESVDPGSPAALAGVKPGDIVLAVNGENVDGRFPEQLPEIKHKIAELPIGSAVTLTLRRDEAPEIKITTEPLESRVGQERVFEKWGMSAQKLTKAVAREKRLENSDGVIIVGLQEAYPADIAKLRRGDIVTKINRKIVASMQDVQQAYEDYEKDPRPMLFEVLRNREVQMAVLKPQN